MRHNIFKKFIPIVLGLLVICFVSIFGVGYSTWYFDDAGAENSQQPKLITNDIVENFINKDKISTNSNVKGFESTSYKLLGGTLANYDDNGESFNYDSPQAPVFNKILFNDNSEYATYNDKDYGLYVAQNVYFADRNGNNRSTTRNLTGNKNTVTGTSTYTAGDIDPTSTFSLTINAKLSGYVISKGNNVYYDWVSKEKGQTSALSTSEATLVNSFGFDASNSNVGTFNPSTSDSGNMQLIDQETDTVIDEVKSGSDSTQVSYYQLFEKIKDSAFTFNSSVKNGYFNVLIYKNEKGEHYIWTVNINADTSSDGVTYFDYIKVVDCTNLTSINYSSLFSLDSDGFLDKNMYSDNGSKITLKGETSSRTIYGVSSFTGGTTIPSLAPYPYPVGYKSGTTPTYSLGSSVTSLYTYDTSTNKETSNKLSSIVKNGYKLIDHQTGQEIDTSTGIDFSKSMLLLLVNESCAFTY